MVDGVGIVLSCYPSRYIFYDKTHPPPLPPGFSSVCSYASGLEVRRIGLRQVWMVDLEVMVGIRKSRGSASRMIEARHLVFFFHFFFVPSYTLHLLIVSMYTGWKVLTSVIAYNLT